MRKKVNASNVTIPSIALGIVILSFIFNLWNSNRLQVDAPSYYAYLPAVFIHQDLKLNFIDQDHEYYYGKIWFIKSENGNRLIKHPLGVSLLLSPFFLLSHLFTFINGDEQTGYSPTYTNGVSIGVLLYLLAGLYFLQKILNNFGRSRAVAFTLITIVFGTNLLWYATFEGLMSHAISFSLLSVNLYSFFNWMSTQRGKMFYLFISSLAFLILVRPLSITLVLFYLLLIILNQPYIRVMISLFYFKKLQIGLGLLLSFIIILPQLFYWKFITGSWLYDVYQHEHFFFRDQEIINFLFSFRKGLFIYSPVLLLTILGMIKVYKINKPLFYSLFLFLSFTVYLLSSWWAWSYGISWGLRPMIDYYPLLCVPLTSSFEMLIRSRTIVKIGGGLLVFVFICFNLFQTWQYKNGLIHYDDMSKESYKIGLFQTTISPGWKDALKPYNWEKRLRGEKQIEYDAEFFQNLNLQNPVSIRTTDLLYLSLSKRTEFIAAAYTGKVTPSEYLFIKYLKNDTVVIKSSNGKFLSLKPHKHQILIADSDTVGTTEKFKIKVLNKDDNKFTLRGSNNMLIQVDGRFPHILRAVSTEPGSREIFRVFYVEDIVRR